MAVWKNNTLFFFVCFCLFFLVIVLLNASGIELGKSLQEFKTFSSEFDPDTRGMVLTNSDEIREAHNSFARPEPISIEMTKDPDEGEDAFHFISYVPFNGFLYEIDGLQTGPRLLGILLSFFYSHFVYVCLCVWKFAGRISFL